MIINFACRMQFVLFSFLNTYLCVLNTRKRAEMNPYVIIPALFY